MLRGLQAFLTDLYQADPGCSIEDFLITDPALAKILGAGSLVPNTEETVFVSQDDEGLAMSVYLDEKVLTRLQRENPLHGLRDELLDDFCKALEGVSHFNYLAWRARRDRPVTLLELELQAEIDKFVSSWLLALEQDDPGLAGSLHSRLFENVSFNPALDDEQRERYRAANDYAARFCHGLCGRLSRDSASGLDELRRFYRLSQAAKISHIHSTAYARA